MFSRVLRYLAPFCVLIFVGATGMRAQRPPSTAL